MPHGHVRVRVAFAGVNRADLLQRAGFYPAPGAPRDIPGLEYSGTIDAMGPGASRFAVGDRVFGLVASVAASAGGAVEGAGGAAPAARSASSSSRSGR
jgi:NADPH:quinone reductase